MKPFLEYLAEKLESKQKEEFKKDLEKELSTLNSFSELEKWARESGYFSDKKLDFTDFGKGRELWINYVIIKPEYQGCGIGSAVIMKAIDLAKINGNKSVNLLASSGYGTEINKLKSFYRHLGFKTYKEGKRKSEDFLRFELQ